MQKSLHWLTIGLLIVILSISLFIAYRAKAENNVTEYKIIPIQLPKYFTPTQWITANRVFGLMGNKFIEFNPETGSWHVLHPNVWAGVMDSSGRFLAYRNEKGLSYLSLGDSKSIIRINPNSDSQPHCWSPDGRYLLYSIADEWTPSYYIYDRESGESRPFTFKNVENFLSEPLGWIKLDGSEELIFSLRFSTSKTGEREYRSAGYRAELYKASLDGTFKPLVQVDDGQFVLFDGFDAKHSLGYYHIFNQEGQIRGVDLTTSKPTTEWSFAQGKQISLSETSKLALINTDYLKLVALQNPQKPLYTFGFEYKRVLWSEDKREALIFPSEESEVTNGYLLQTQ